MAKLKCWKKQKYNSYNGHTWWKRRDKLDDKTGRYEVTIGEKHSGEYSIFLPHIVIKKENKKDALKVAMKYMEKNDCKVK